MWALYHRVKGWLVDSVDVYSWDVAKAAWFHTEQRALETIAEMNQRGFELDPADFTACRVTEAP